MSRLTELIEELCPDGVEYRPLGELGSFFGGLSGKTKSDFVEIEDARPFVTYREVYSLIEIDRCPQGRVLVLPHEKQLALCRGDVLFTGSSENADEVGLTAVVTTDFSEPVYLNSFSICLRWYDATFDSGYAKYLFTSSEVRRQIRRCASGVTRFNLSKKRLEGVSIPVPPLEVQREIARILDQFTTLEAELEAELEARRIQYEHYRNHLLSYESLAACGQVEMVKLGECIKLSFGERITKMHDAGTRYPVFGGGGASFMTDSFNRSDEFVISRFALSEVCVRFVPGEFWLLDSGITFDVNESRCVKRYIGQFLLSRQNEIYRKSAGAAQRNLKTAEFLSMGIPLPGLSEQRRIADLLDRFDALVNDISSGLPAEIAARRAQYEHYRDRLLSFPEKAGSGGSVAS